jgi:hypothetical protein
LAQWTIVKYLCCCTVRSRAAQMGRTAPVIRVTTCLREPVLQSADMARQVCWASILIHTQGAVGHTDLRAAPAVHAPVLRQLVDLVPPLAGLLRLNLPVLLLQLHALHLHASPVPSQHLQLVLESLLKQGERTHTSNWERPVLGRQT